MNDLLKKLAQESGVYFGEATQDYFGDKYPAFVSTDDMDLEKFSRLIVKECVDIALSAAKDTNFTHSAVTASDMRALGIAAQIRTHFGIKE